jgi:hypothetical protein
MYVTADTWSQGISVVFSRSARSFLSTADEATGIALVAAV